VTGVEPCAALPAEAFLEVPRDIGTLVGRFAAGRQQADPGADGEAAEDTATIDLRQPRTAD
jgi:hypothetical protein